jgi:hypothetical protein
MSRENLVGDAEGFDAVRNSSSIGLYRRGVVRCLKCAVYGVQLFGDVVKWILKLSRFPIHGSVSRYPLTYESTPAPLLILTYKSLTSSSD